MFLFQSVLHEIGFQFNALLLTFSLIANLRLQLQYPPPQSVARPRLAAQCIIRCEAIRGHGARLGIAQLSINKY